MRVSVVITRSKMNRDEYIGLIINEDLENGDATTDPIFSNEQTTAKLIVKEDGIIAGIELFKAVFAKVDSNVNLEFVVRDGEFVTSGQLLAKISGQTKSILHAERVALNIMQRMSGVATLTNMYVQKLESTNCNIFDTRKTTPLMRELEKEAVVIGGGKNHRYNLGDQVLIKDNHIAAAGSIAKAVKLTKDANPSLKIQVECEDIKQVQACLDTGVVDIIMLDNMSNQLMAECVKLIDKRCSIEASGNMNLERVGSVSKLGVDRISVGNITHSYKSLDISLKMGV